MLKGGEEVRTDQRVEQLFDVMNGLLRRSPAAAAAGLQVNILVVGKLQWLPSWTPPGACSTCPSSCLSWLFTSWHDTPVS